MIDIENLSFSFGRRQRLFENLSLSLPPGGICGLLGKNGSGKTTLLKLMSGLRFPKDGHISVYEKAPADRSVDFLQDMFFLPEVFDLPPVTVARYQKLYGPFYPGFKEAVFHSYLQDFEISRNQKLNGISHGQKKKFMIAFGLATGCRLMLLDEPTNGLDIAAKSCFRKAVASCLTDERIFIIATHQVRDLENLIDPVVILDDGRIIFNQSMEAVARRLEAVFSSEKPDSGRSLYSERKMGGYLNIVENRGETDTDIDIEMLFNCVVNNRDRIAQIFQRDESS